MPINCCICNECAGDQYDLEVHIATQHVHYSPYSCEHCHGAQFASDYALRRHYLADHRQKIFNVKYRVSPELDQKKQLLDQFLEKSLANLPTTSTASFKIGIPPISISSCIKNTHQLTKFIIDASLGTDPSLNEHKELTDVSNSFSNGQGVHSDDNFASGAYGEPNKMRGTDKKEPDLFDLNQIAPALGTEYKPNFVGNGEVGGDGELIDPQRMLMMLGGGHSQVIDVHNTTDQPSTKRKKRRNTVKNEVHDRHDADDPNKPKIECSECHRIVGNYTNSLILHVSTHHCESPMFECLACDKKWYSLSARTRDHIYSRHDGDMSLLQDNRSKLMPELKATMNELFPRRSGHVP